MNFAKHIAHYSSPNITLAQNEKPRFAYHVIHMIPLSNNFSPHNLRYVTRCSNTDAFIQAHMPKLERGEDQVIMKITGVLVDLLVQMAPETYGAYVVKDR